MTQPQKKALAFIVAAPAIYGVLYVLTGVAVDLNLVDVHIDQKTGATLAVAIYPALSFIGACVVMENAPRIERAVADQAIRLRERSLGLRAFVAGAILWPVLLLAYMFLFEPFPRLDTFEAMGQYLRLVLFGVAALGAGCLAYEKLLR
jgi:hypothetical protein